MVTYQKLDFSDPVAMAIEAKNNVLHSWRWRHCEHFIVGFETRRRFAPSQCALRHDFSGCIGCTKFSLREDDGFRKEGAR